MEFVKRNLATLLTVILFIGSIVGFILILSYISKSTLTSRENLLISILLTICSTVVSWILTHVYANNEHDKKISEIKSDYAKNLQLYAQKASEKVDNLSNELSKLTIFLKDELENELDTPEHDLFSKKERIQSAIHIIGTLKSINDRSLSDWQGVIPEEIEEKREIQRESNEELLDVISKFQDLRSDKISKDEHLAHEVANLQKKLDSLVFSRTGGLSLNKKVRSLKVKTESNCPKCGVNVIYKQRPLIRSIKKFKCQSCDVRLASMWNEEKRSFVLQLDQDSQEEREKSNMDINDELMEKVFSSLPPQPWPKGTAKEIKEKLKLTSYKYHKIIRALIEQGRIKEQKDGKILDKQSNLQQ